ncbi:MAG TPA: alpha/beta hydrolase [Xanthobacteraceae bacterium]|nr:alpha/beta hydrolase [Xanthobacteraceae bacterium]
MSDAALATGTDACENGFESLFVSAPDGLRLHLRRYGAPAPRRLPIVCLPGLTRNGADFHEVGCAFGTAAAEPRLVVAVDARGRGRSDFDPRPENYALAVELGDLLAVLSALEIGPAVFLGTSRGGVLAMLLGAARPAAISGVILNDIGPVVDAKGLMRLKGYVGKLPTPSSFSDGAEILRRLGSAQFTAMTQAQWLAQAKRTWRETEEGLALDYDPKLAATLAAVDIERPLPPLWAQFDSLARFPLMLIRGANSDLLSAATVDAMRARRLDIDVLEVPDQGHAPLLIERDVIARIAAFVTLCDVSAFGF